ncbi:MoaD/ThiS family protein [Mycolicibacterium sp. XJ1819]
MKVTVRYFAAARAAAGVDDEILGVEAGTTVGDLVEVLSARDAHLAKVLARCTFLCDGVAVRDATAVLGDAQTVDVLPPFAGG